MFTLNINGKNFTCESDKRLIDFLRDDLAFTSVKEGCSAGACGTCMVLVDGKAKQACVLKLSKLSGCSIITVEGLSQKEKDIYSYCFAEAGAVQCGFCIPGMVISAKGLLDVNNNPTRDEIKKAIRGNICRCTGYVKIIDAIELAAQFIRETIDIPVPEFTGQLGENFHRVDSHEKTLGTGKYVDDLKFDGMVFAKALRTKYPRARILDIDISAAKAHPDVIKVILASDVPGNIKLGHLNKDWDALIGVGDTTRYIGDALAIVVANTQAALEEALKLINVTYEQLTPVTSPADALKEGASKIHETGNLLKEEHLVRGDVDEAIKNASHVVTYHFSTPFTEHAFMEPECAIAMPNGEDGLRMFTSSQSVYDEQKEISSMLGIEPEKIHITSQLVGGGFGGKEDMSVQHHAALAAWLTGKCVKIKFSRQESILIHPKRHAMEMDFTLACDKDGILTGLKATIISDTGAYASLGGPVLQRACTHAAGPYTYQNIDITGKAVYTNNPPAGAFRGFGVAQSCFALESCINLLAEKVGISGWEIRYRNAIRIGKALPNGQIADEGTAFVECLEALKETFDANPNAGIAAGLKNAGIGVGIPDISRCIISVENGKIHIRTSASCIGQGIATVTTQIACETLQLPPSLMVAEPPDTIRTPNAGTTTASRQTVFTGEATRRAALLLKEELSSGKTLADLEGKEFYGEYGSVTDPLGSKKPNPVSHVAYGYAAVLVTLSDNGKVDKVYAAYDAGTVVNQLACEGQIEGGIIMSLGYALTEDYPLVDSFPKAKFGTLGLYRAVDIPEINIKMIQPAKRAELAYGSKGVGELATIPAAPAVQHAYYNFDSQFRTKLPLENTFYKKTKKER